MAKTTRFMEVMFSNTDEDAAKQVDNDIKEAQAKGVVDDSVNNLKYERTSDGSVAITDKENGEVTLAKKADDAADTYDLVAVPDGELEKYLHPSADGRHVGSQVGAPDEDIKDHVGEDGNCPDCDDEEDEKKFSVYTDNTVVQRIFSDQEYCERIFSDVLETGETAHVGDLVVENLPEEGALKVTDTNSDDAAVVKYDDETGELVVDEKTSTKEFSDEEYEPLHIVGVEPINHVLVDAPAYTEDDADELARRLTEDGVENIQIFDDFDEARDYAMNLLEGLGVNSSEDVEEPEQVEYSEVGDIFVTRYYSDNTWTEVRMFSEAINGVSDLQDTIVDAVENGDQIETEDEIITPVDAENAVIEDKATGEFTKATVDDDSVELNGIDKKEAKELTDNLEVEDEEDEKKFSEGEIYTDEAETRFFSEYEDMTSYMERLFSEESDQNVIEDAIANGDEIENEKEIITPVDAKTAVVEDKENGEFTKATIDSDEELEVHPISEEEAKELTDNLEVEDTDEDEDEEDEKKFSEGEIYTNEAETRFFSEHEDMTSYMERLFSEESDQNVIEDAIANGDEIENEKEIVTPIDAKTAVVEDKENGEFTKATIDNDEELEVHPISEEEAKELTDNLEVEDTDKDEEDEKKDEKKFSNTLEKFFADALAPQQPMPQGSVQNAQPVQPVDPNAQPAPAPSVEEVEDKAIAAVQSIKAAAEEAAATIMDAKAAPAPNAEPDLQEAQFSEKNFCGDDASELVSWLRK